VRVSGDDLNNGRVWLCARPRGYRLPVDQWFANSRSPVYAEQIFCEYHLPDCQLCSDYSGRSAFICSRYPGSGRLERAECEFLTGNFDTAEQLIGELLQRAAPKVDQEAVYHLKVLLHTVKSENKQAVATALTCLRLFGIDIPAHPTQAQVQAEYETVWQTLNGRPIESVIELPLMTDPELQAAMQVLSVLAPPAYFTDFHLFCLLACRMVKVSTLLSIRLSFRAWAWDWRSAVRLAKLTEDGCGRRQMRPEAPSFSSRCRFAMRNWSTVTVRIDLCRLSAIFCSIVRYRR
jgi:hypothetical protein